MSALHSNQERNFQKKKYVGKVNIKVVIRVIYILRSVRQSFFTPRLKYECYNDNDETTTPG